jgi:hypothetical protein
VWLPFTLAWTVNNMEQRYSSRSWVILSPLLSSLSLLLKSVAQLTLESFPSHFLLFSCSMEPSGSRTVSVIHNVAASYKQAICLRQSIRCWVRIVESGWRCVNCERRDSRAACWTSPESVWVLSVKAWICETVTRRELVRSACVGSVQSRTGVW